MGPPVKLRGEKNETIILVASYETFCPGDHFSSPEQLQEHRNPLGRISKSVAINLGLKNQMHP